MRNQLSKNFYLDEFTFSETAIRHGIDNQVAVGSGFFYQLQRLCETILQPLRDVLGPIHITSGYRKPLLNHLIGGSENSQHTHCLAADIKAVNHSPRAVCETAIELELPFDQLIYEFGRWTHLSIAPENEQPRKQVLTAYKIRPIVGSPLTKYANGLLEEV